jgi:hypothetical protein
MPVTGPGATSWKAVFFVLFNYLPYTLGNFGHGTEIFKPALVLFGSYLSFHFFYCI